MNTRESDNMVHTTRGPMPRSALTMAVVIEETPTSIDVAIEWRVRGEDPASPGAQCVGGELVRRDFWANGLLPLKAEAVAAPLGG